MTNRGAVLVTGTSSGIGRATAQALVKAGFRVFAGVRKPEDGEALRREAGEGIVPTRMDLTDPASIAAAVEQVQAQVGSSGLAGVVNNAGIGLSGPLELLPLRALRQQFEVNVLGQVAVIQAFLPLLRLGRGRIVNIGSIGDRLSIPFGGALCGSKSAFAAMTDSLRLELAPFGIRVCLIEPGAIATPAVDKTLGDPDAVFREAGAEAAQRYRAVFHRFTERAQARERSGSPPEVVAQAVLHALTARRPPARTLVGKGSRVLATLAWLLPPVLLDRVRGRALGLPGFGALAPADGRSAG
jgi:NAD(P)-dependent dehydrogenase (short-subunit alcohol dehydrogenase family)